MILLLHCMVVIWIVRAMMFWCYHYSLAFANLDQVCLVNAVPF